MHCAYYIVVTQSMLWGYKHINFYDMNHLHFMRLNLIFRLHVKCEYRVPEYKACLYAALESTSNHIWFGRVVEHNTFHIEECKAFGKHGENINKKIQSIYQLDAEDYSFYGIREKKQHCFDMHRKSESFKWYCKKSTAWLNKAITCSDVKMMSNEWLQSASWHNERRTKQLFFSFFYDSFCVCVCVDFLFYSCIRLYFQDYSSFFQRHALNSTYPGYRAPPGTQHFGCQYPQYPQFNQ